MASAGSLPDSIWLKILIFCDPVEVAKVGNVNRRFYHMSRDKSLWRRIDVSETKLTVRKLGMLIRRDISDHVISLRIEGSLHKLGRKRKISQIKAVTPALLSDLQQRCPNLRELHINHANIDNVNLRQFPTTLTFLSLRDSEIAFNGLEDLKNTEVLPNLTGLDVGSLHNFSSLSKSVSGLLTRNSLTKISLRKCFKVNKSHLCEIPAGMPELEFLDVGYLTNVDDDFLYQVSENSKNLKELDLSFCKKFTAQGVRALAKSEIKLEKLWLTEDTQINDEALKHILSLRTLKFLNTVMTSCTKDGINRFKSKLEACHVESVLSETNKKVGESFWFISMKEV